MPRTGIFHPDFFYHPRPVIQSAMLADVQVLEPTGEHSDWFPGQTVEDANLYTLRYKGKARIQPNKDWRARAREQGLEFGATHAIRVQIGINTNQYYSDPETKTLHPDASEDFSKDWIVIVDQSFVDGTEYMDGDTYYVRNAKKSSNAWVHNLLCDTNTKE